MQFTLSIIFDDRNLEESVTAFAKLQGVLDYCRKHGLDPVSNGAMPEAPAALAATVAAPVRRSRSRKEPEPEPPAETEAEAKGADTELETDPFGGEEDAAAAPAKPVVTLDDLAARLRTMLSAVEAKAKAIAYARQVYAVPGGNTAVKEVQKLLKVAKFSDVPEADGYVLLAHMIPLAKQFNVKVDV